ncbi:MAG: two-component system, sensor histidine kinase YesM [Clostridiales bacterium]|nr:two-component system, sensor histidine kinase YesM [Clostridiales bacterium]
MKLRIRDMSFRTKIMFTYLLLLFVTIVIFGICYIQGVSSALTNNILYMEQANYQKNKTLDLAMGNNSSLNLLHLIDPKVNIILHERKSKMTQAQRYERNSYMQTSLKMLTVINPHVQRTSIVTTTGDTYCSVNKISDDYIAHAWELIEQIDWKTRSQKYYTVPYPQSIGSSGYSMVTIIHQLSDIGAHKNFAYLLVDLDFGAVAEALQSMEGEEGVSASFAIIKEDQVIYNSRNAFLNLETDLTAGEKREVFQKLEKMEASKTKEGEIRIHGKRCVATVMKNEATGWYLIQYIEKQHLIRTSMQSMLSVMQWVLLLLLIAAILSLVLSQKVSRPIKALADTMRQARQGEVTLYETEAGVRNDEIGNLIESYNAMGKRINDSITKLYIMQLNQKQAELKMLQAQINPHFLYNALNTITAIARLSDIEEIPEITESLSDMFRYSIKGADFVTLQDELLQLKNYLRIQSIRFPGRFLVEYEIPEELLLVGVIKFILQPIVENSIHHAFTVKRERDYMKISAFKEGENLVISIYDDGSGIAMEMLGEINQRLQTTKANELVGEDSLSEEGMGIGLSNVNARLKNYYGEDCGIHVESVEGSYTCIYLRMKQKEVG